MQRKLLLWCALVLATTVGCASGPSSWSSWNPLAWGQTKPNMQQSTWAQNKAANKAGPVAGQQPTGLAGAWKNTTDAIAAPFKPKTVNEDAVTLGEKPPQASADVFVATGRLYEAKGDVPNAAAQYERALQVAPKDLHALVSLGRLRDRQGQYDQAVQVYLRAAAAHPKSALVHNDLGLCYARHQQSGPAMAELRTAVALQPDNAMYRNNLAAVLVEQGKEQEAFQQLATVNPPAVAHYNLAFLLHQRGLNDAAVRHLTESVNQDRSLTAAQALLAQLQPPPHAEVARLPQTPGVPATPAGYQPAGYQPGYQPPAQQPGAYAPGGGQFQPGQ